MKRQTLKRLMIKGTVAYVAVFSLVLMVAMPAMALIIAARNSVNRRSIINGEVTYKELAKNSVRTAKIAPRAVRYGKIASGAVRGNHIKDGHVKSADIGNGTILNADISGAAAISASKINSAGLNADLLDGSHASAFAASDHDHGPNPRQIALLSSGTALIKPIPALPSAQGPEALLLTAPISGLRTEPQTMSPS